jgi:hypothetical protein
MELVGELKPLVVAREKGAVHSGPCGLTSLPGLCTLNKLPWSGPRSCGWLPVVFAIPCFCHSHSVTLSLCGLWWCVFVL